MIHVHVSIVLFQQGMRLVHFIIKNSTIKCLNETLGGTLIGVQLQL